MDEKKIKEQIKEQKIGATELTSKEEETIKTIFELAKQPVIMSDSDFKCGEGELDIRNLNAKNLRQMQFRADMLEVAYLKNICDNQTDIIRLLLVIAKKMGVANVADAISDVITELHDKLNKGA
jgi:hypothetical protein